MIWRVKPKKQGPPHKEKPITWNINNNVPDKYGNIYLPRDKIDMVLLYSANSNRELTIDIVDKVIAPYIEA